MKLDVRHYSDREKRVLASMVLDVGVLGPVAAKWPKQGLFKTPQANRLGRLVIRYFQKHDRVPKKVIRTIVGDYLEDKNHDKLLEEYAAHLLEEIEVQQKRKQPTSYSLEAANRHFDSVRMLQIKELIEAGTEKNGDLTAEAITKAEELLRQRIAVGGSRGIYNLEDDVLDRQEEEQDAAVLFRYPGDIGLFFGDEFMRGGFLSFVSGPKIGKSWWLADVVWTAVSQGCRAFFFELGDLGQRKHQRYLMQRICTRPKKGKAGKFQWPQRILIEGNQGQTRNKVREFKEMSSSLVKKKRDAAIDDPTMLRSYYYHSMEFNVASLRSELENAEREGVLPDIVAIDYADLLVPPGMEEHRRHVVDQIWKELRRIALELDCLVVTATQTKTEGYNKNGDKPFLLGPEHFSDSRTKNDHVTGMIGLNQTRQEKKYGVMRLNWVIRREEYGNPDECCYVAGNLGLGRPVIISEYAY